MGNQINIGDSVTSKLTGVKIIVTKISKTFIVGKEVGFIQERPNYRTYDGTKILSYKNIAQ